MEAKEAGIVPVEGGAAFDALRERWAALPTEVQFKSAAEQPGGPDPVRPDLCAAAWRGDRGPARTL